MSLRHHLTLLDDICHPKNLNAACRKVVSNQGSAGIDDMSVEELTSYLREHGADLRQSLLAGTYQPNTLKQVQIPKPNGSHRQLGIPTVIDRWIQQAIAQVLGSHLDPTFSEHSYGFRPDRSAHQALIQAQSYLANGYQYAVDLDLAQFFDRVNQDRLMSKLRHHIGDQRVLNLIRRYLNAGMTPGTGVPQGSPLSPLLSNLYLHDLDRELERRGHRFVRYADDIMIFVQSEAAATRVMSSVSDFIVNKLKLQVNTAKSTIGQVGKFLGYLISKTKRVVQPANIKAFKDKIRAVTKIRGGQALSQAIDQLRPIINGWYEYFKLQTNAKLFKGLDGWTRRRVRACAYQSLGNGGRRLEVFQQNGIRYNEAYPAAYSSRGAWHNSHCRTMQTWLCNRVLAEMGLVSLVREVRPER